MNVSKTISPPQEKKITGSTQTKNEQKPKALVILRGITTSQINQALKAKGPYPARVFLKVEGYKEDIPTIFRISKLGNWIRPKIPTKSQIEVQGHLSNPTNESQRPSFTAYSYTLLACPWSQSKPYHCPIDCQCLKGKDLRNKVISEHNQKLSEFINSK